MGRRSRLLIETGQSRQTFPTAPQRDQPNKWPGFTPPSSVNHRRSNGLVCYRCAHAVIQKIFFYNELYPDPRFLNCLSDLQEGQNVPFGAVQRK